MIYTTRIPDEIKNVSIAPGNEVLVDTKGLDCILAPEGGNIYVSLVKNAAADARFPLCSGQSLDFCGKLYVGSESGASVGCLFYRTL